MRFGDRHPPIVIGFSGGIRPLVLLGGCDLCLQAARASVPMSHSLIVVSSCDASCQCTSYVGCVYFGMCWCQLVLISSKSFVGVYMFIAIWRVACMFDMIHSSAPRMF